VRQVLLDHEDRLAVATVGSNVAHRLAATPKVALGAVLAKPAINSRRAGRHAGTVSRKTPAAMPHCPAWVRSDSVPPLCSAEPVVIHPGFLFTRERPQQRKRERRAVGCCVNRSASQPPAGTWRAALQDYPCWPDGGAAAFTIASSIPCR
jgi:hypothetical protein